MRNILGLSGRKPSGQPKDDRREKNYGGIDRRACFDRGDLGGCDLRVHLHEQERPVGTATTCPLFIIGEGMSLRVVARVSRRRDLPPAVKVER